MKTYLFHGQAGAGKDTQVEKLLEKYPQFERIATGEMFRTLNDEGDPFAVEVYGRLKQGIWQTPEEVYTLLDKWLKRFDNNKDWILVSVVRYAEQIPYLDRTLEKYGRKLDKVIHFSLSEAEAMRRLADRKICPKDQSTYHPIFKPEKVTGVCDLCGGELIVRDDDKPAGIKKRFDQYAETIKPFVEAYTKRGVFVDIDASPSIDAIHEQVLKVLDLSK